jgi:hypothetical protein
MDMSHPFQVSTYRIATCFDYRANRISPLQDASQNVMEPCKKCNLLPSTASCLLIQLVALSSSMKRTCCNGLRLKPRSLKKLLQSPSESLTFRSNPMRACHWQSNDVQNILKGFAKAPLAAKGIPGVNNYRDNICKTRHLRICVTTSQKQKNCTGPSAKLAPIPQHDSIHREHNLNHARADMYDKVSAAVKKTNCSKGKVIFKK